MPDRRNNDPSILGRPEPSATGSVVRGSPPLLQPTIQQLQYLVAVSDAPTFSAAAAACSVSTSALSQGLAELERRLGVRLFEREGRRQVLRAESAEVLAYARRVVTDTLDISRWVHELKGGRAGRLRVGMIDAAAVEHCADQLRSFRRVNEGVDLLLSVAPSAELLQRLARGDLDLAVVVEPEPVPGEFEFTALLDEDIVVVPPDGTSLGEPDSWGPWVLFPTGSHTRALVERELRARGARVEVVAESHQPDVLREMARLGVGWTALPAVQAGGGSQRTRSSVVLTRRRLVIARLRARSAHGAADRFAASLQG
jgi:DNA-binding transcriptional LysR family regulator